MASLLGDSSICSDFNLFMETLKENRLIDDRIIYELNKTIPTRSFAANVDVSEQCKGLADKVIATQSRRVDAIKTCIKHQAHVTQKIKDEREQNPEDFKLKKQLGREQSNLRLLRQELGIEEIIQERVRKTFHERCRSYYHS